MKLDFDGVYEELYSHFARRPDDLHRLNWRDFERLLAQIFESQGFETELGAGLGDGGVDVRLLQRDPLGDIMTLVQAKKYAPGNKINLEAVAALHGVASVENAHRSIFVTTSDYLPSAKQFAARTSGMLELRTSQDVVRWCETASAGIVRDKTLLTSEASVLRTPDLAAKDFRGRVVVADTGYTMILNSFALIIKETKNAALLMSLPRSRVSDDGYGQEGQEVPLFHVTAISHFRSNTVWRAKRIVRDSQVSFWDGRNLYFPWNGRPVHFSYID